MEGFLNILKYVLLIFFLSYLFFKDYVDAGYQVEHERFAKAHPWFDDYCVACPMRDNYQFGSWWSSYEFFDPIVIYLGTWGIHLQPPCNVLTSARCAESISFMYLIFGRSYALLTAVFFKACIITTVLLAVKTWFERRSLWVSVRSDLAVAQPVRLATFTNDFNRSVKERARITNPDPSNPHGDLAAERKVWTNACAQALSRSVPVVDICGVPSRYDGDISVVCLLPRDGAHAVKTNKGLAVINSVAPTEEIKPHGGIDRFPMMVDSDWYYTAEQLVTIFCHGGVILTRDFTGEDSTTEKTVMTPYGVIHVVSGANKYRHGYHLWERGGGVIANSKGILHYSVVRRSSRGRMCLYLTPVSGTASTSNTLKSFGITQWSGPFTDWALDMDRKVYTCTVSQANSDALVTVPLDVVLDFGKTIDISGDPNTAEANRSLICSRLKSCASDNPSSNMSLLSVQSILDLLTLHFDDRQPSKPKTFDVSQYLNKTASFLGLEAALAVDADLSPFSWEKFKKNKVFSDAPRAAAAPQPGPLSGSLPDSGGCPGQDERSAESQQASIDGSGAAAPPQDGETHVSPVSSSSESQRPSSRRREPKRGGKRVAKKQDKNAKGKTPKRKRSRVPAEAPADNVVLCESRASAQTGATEHQSGASMDPIVIGSFSFDDMQEIQENDVVRWRIDPPSPPPSAREISNDSPDLQRSEQVRPSSDPNEGVAPNAESVVAQGPPSEVGQGL